MEFKTYPFSHEEWNTCLKVLRELKEDPFNNPDNEQLGGLISSIHKKAKKLANKERYEALKTEVKQTTQSSTISRMALENGTQFEENQEDQGISYSELPLPKNCYSCNASYVMAHSFYNRLCPVCAQENFANRSKTVDLTNRNVILTGGRVKIGYATALKLLRSNANLTLTTRLPALAWKQFEQEKDYHQWKNRLHIYGLDLRNLKALHEFIADYESKHDHLDILINNAAQTIKYTPEYYAPLVKKENKLLASAKEPERLIPNRTPIADNIPLLESGLDLEEVNLNRFGQPVDYRAKNSWNSTLEEIDLEELLEVNLINQISPYLLIKELAPLMRKSPFSKRFIINVTSSEGQFSYTNKSQFHPHTNMTKASLNMLTRTSGKSYQDMGIYMNAVDVGWVSTGAREELRKKQFEMGYIPPLDPVDGASRIIVPIADEIEKDHRIYGKLIKNYRVEDW